MSNYIRTGLAINEVEWDNREEKWKDVKTPCHFILDEMISGVDYKFSDTIEELCDCIVVIRSDYDNPIIVYDYNLKRVCERQFENWSWCYVAIYGAIWTDKGLIYVAKMNEKGELELI